MNTIILALVIIALTEVVFGETYSIMCPSDSGTLQPACVKESIDHDASTFTCSSRKYKISCSENDEVLNHDCSRETSGKNSIVCMQNFLQSSANRTCELNEIELVNPDMCFIRAKCGAGQTRPPVEACLTAFLKDLPKVINCWGVLYPNKCP